MNERTPRAGLFARLAVSALLVLSVSACSLGRQLAPVSMIDPEIAVRPQPDWVEVDWALQVQRPVTDRMRDSERILVRTESSRLQPYPDAAWLDSVPDMLQTLTIQALEDANRFNGVGRPGTLRSRFALVTELRRFEAVDEGSSDLVVDLVIQAGLVDQRRGSLVASRVFRVREASTGKRLDSLVPAFERALQSYLGDLTGWVLSEGRRVQQERERSESERPAGQRG